MLKIFLIILCATTTLGLVAGTALKKDDRPFLRMDSNKATGHHPEHVSSRDAGMRHHPSRRLQKKPKVAICKVPPGDPDNFHTIEVSENAVQAHLNTGSLLGSCDENCDTVCNDTNACTIDVDTSITTGCSCHATPRPPVVCTDDFPELVLQGCDEDDGCQYLCAPGYYAITDQVTGQESSMECPVGTSTYQPGSTSCSLDVLCKTKENGVCTSCLCSHTLANGNCQQRECWSGETNPINCTGPGAGAQGQSGPCESKMFCLEDTSITAYHYGLRCTTLSGSGTLHSHRGGNLWGTIFLPGSDYDIYCHYEGAGTGWHTCSHAGLAGRGHVHCQNSASCSYAFLIYPSWEGTITATEPGTTVYYRLRFEDDPSKVLPPCTGNPPVGPCCGNDVDPCIRCNAMPDDFAPCNHHLS